MDKLPIILNEKYVKLKQLLIDGEVNEFEKKISKLDFDELLEFSYYSFKSYTGKDFSNDYFGVKVMGELTYLCSTRDLLVFNSIDFEEDKFWDLIFRGLVHASEKALELGYYSDSEKYGLQLIDYPQASSSDLLHFLSNLALSAHKMNDTEKELLYCEKMLELDDKNPKILVNYSYALMRNENYEKSKLYLEKCIDFGYEAFAVYNQLAIVTMYGYKDYEKAYSYLEEIFDKSNGGERLNERDSFVMLSNILTVGGLSGNERMLKDILEFKNSANQIENAEGSKKWIELCSICESLNRGIYALEHGDIQNAINIFKELDKYNWQGELIELIKFLASVCQIIKESETVKTIGDVESIIDFIEHLESIELFEDYKNIIEIYFSLLHSFLLLLDDKIEGLELKKSKERVRKFRQNNLTTSDFINKSFKLIKIIEEYKIDFSNSILKERIKDDYRQKIELLINSKVDIANETTFLYSLNRLDNLNQALCELIIKTIHLMQKNEPSFIRDYKMKNGVKVRLLETDFRDIIYRSFGLSYDIEISAEALSRVGRTDLQIESKKFGTKTFEFKIWGNNDYKTVVKQLYEYLTDFEEDGFIFMANKNKNSIESEYIKNLKSDDMGYIPNSFHREEIRGFQYFISKHKIHIKTKTVYHFIYNMY